MSVPIDSPEAVALIASHLGGQKLDAAGMTAAAFVTQKLIAAGEIVTNCPDGCGGAG